MNMVQLSAQLTCYKQGLNSQWFYLEMIGAVEPPYTEETPATNPPVV